MSRFPCPRWRLRSVLIAVAALSLALGGLAELRDRQNRYRALWQEHSRLAIGLGHVLDGDPPNRKGVLWQAHWHNAVAWRYEKASRRPWTSFAPDPSVSYCSCLICLQP